MSDADNAATSVTPALWVTYRPLLVGAVLFFVTAGLYVSNFQGPLSADNGTWGQFGDYMGGVVNPLLGLITIWLLVGTLAQQQRAVVAAHESIRVQQEALKVQREELTETRKELAISAEALENQVRQFDRKSEKDDLFSRADKVLIEAFELLKAGNVATVISYLRAGATHPDSYNTSVTKSLTTLREMPHDAALQELDESSRRFYIDLSRLLRELNGYLQRIDELSDGSQVSTNYFRRRVIPWASALRTAHVLEDEIELQLRTLEPQSPRVAGNSARARNPRA